MKGVVPSSFSSQFDGRAEVLLPQVFQVEVEGGLEDGVQHPLDAVGRGAGVGQAGHHLRQFRDRRYPHLVPIEERMHQRREGLLRRVVTGVFQATGEQQVLDHRAAGVAGRRLVVLLQHLVDLGELGGAADGGHGDGSGGSTLDCKLQIADFTFAILQFATFIAPVGPRRSSSGGSTSRRIWATAIERLTP